MEIKAEVAIAEKFADLARELGSLDSPEEGVKIAESMILAALPIITAYYSHKAERDTCEIMDAKVHIDLMIEQLDKFKQDFGDEL